MSQGDFHQALRDAVEQRHWKAHPFSEAWVSGGLNRRSWESGSSNTTTMSVTSRNGVAVSTRIPTMRLPTRFW